MLGHGLFNDDYAYCPQTIKCNFSLLTPEVLGKINQIMVEAGHDVLEKGSEAITGKCDSFVVETAIHYPTDTSLLFDAIRKVISLLPVMCVLH